MRRENHRLGGWRKRSSKVFGWNPQTTYAARVGKLPQFYGHATSSIFSTRSEFEKVRTLHTFAGNCENKSQKSVLPLTTTKRRCFHTTFTTHFTTFSPQKHHNENTQTR
jgi:hypothetical protein